MTSLGRPEVLLVADGASTHTRRIARALVERGITVELAAFESADVPGVLEHSLGTRPVRDDIRYLLAISRLTTLVASRRPRVVHAHYVSSYGVMAAAASLALAGTRVPLVQTAWGTDLLVTARHSRIRRLLAAFALRRAALVTGDSDDLLNEVARLAPATPRLRFIFGPPRALFERPRRAEAIVVSSRRLDADMRVPVVVHAFRRARDLAPAVLSGWQLVVAGSGTRENEVVVAADGDSAVRLAGMLDHETLHSLLLRARVVVSVPESDATSAALLEAMAAGVTPVVNDLPANREWVDDGVGVVVSHDPSVDELARALILAAERRSNVAAIRDRVRTTVWEEQVDALITSYRRL